MELSVVVPVYRSANHAVSRLSNIIQTFRCKYREFEVVFIIDNDAINVEIDKLIELSKQMDEIKIFYLNHNYGQHFATLCGYYLAKGDFIACIDEDMFEYLSEICKTDEYFSYEVYYFYYNKNEMYHSSVRKVFSILYKRILSTVVNLKKHSTFRIITRSLRDKMLIDKHYYWNLDVMVYDNAQHVGGITIVDCILSDKESNYTYLKLINMAFEIVYEHNTIFMHSIISFFLAVLFFIFTNKLLMAVLFWLIIVLVATLFFKLILLNTDTTISKIEKALKK